MSGRRQTNNRAELAAFADFLLQCCRLAERDAWPPAEAWDLHYVTDSLYLVQNLAKARRRATAGTSAVSSNADLWNSVTTCIDFLEASGLTVHPPHKVESHIGNDPTAAARFPDHWVFGNSTADALAEAAACGARVDPAIVAEHRRIEGWARCVRERLVTVLRHCAASDPRAGHLERKPKTLRGAAAARVRVAVRTSGHDLDTPLPIRGRAWRCLRCYQAFQGSLRDAATWVASPCKDPALGKSPWDNVLRPAGEEAITVAGRLLDSTHQLIFAGVSEFWACLSCGAVARQAVRALGRPCPGRLSKNGAENLRRLDRGLHPGSSKDAGAANEPFRQGRSFAPEACGRLGLSHAVHYG